MDTTINIQPLKFKIKRRLADSLHSYYTHAQHTITVLHLLIITSINAHFFIYIYDPQLKSTKSTALTSDLVAFAFYLNQNKQGETQFAFTTNCKQKRISPM